MSKEKRRFGDRRDGKLIRQQDGMHLIMPMIYPNRCDNEAFISERIDLTNIDKYLAAKNAENLSTLCSISLSPRYSRPSYCGRSSTASLQTRTTISAIHTAPPSS